jgi:hypothetical protein
MKVLALLAVSVFALPAPQYSERVAQPQPQSQPVGNSQMNRFLRFDEVLPQEYIGDEEYENMEFFENELPEYEETQFI